VSLKSTVKNQDSNHHSNSWFSFVKTPETAAKPLRSSQAQNPFRIRLNCRSKEVVPEACQKEEKEEKEERVVPNEMQLSWI